MSVEVKVANDSAISSDNDSVIAVSEEGSRIVGSPNVDIINVGNNQPSYQDLETKLAEMKQLLEETMESKLKLGLF